MRQILVTGKRQLTVKETAEPEIRDADDIKIRVEYAGVCTNDRLIWDGSLANPYVGGGLGSEFSGVIADLGKEARLAGFRKGQRVSGFVWRFCGKCPYCRSGRENLCINLSAFTPALADYLVIKDKMTCALPDSVSMKTGCLMVPVANCLHGMEKLGMAPGESLLVLGGGISGQIMTQMAAMYGAERITLADRVRAKRTLGRQSGASFVLDPDAEDFYEQAGEITGFLGFDNIINISHEPADIRWLSGLSARGGKILLFTQYKPEDTGLFNMAELYVKETTVMSAYLSPYSLDRAAKLMDRLDLERLIGAEYPVDNVQSAFEEYAKGVSPRIVIRFDGSK